MSLLCRCVSEPRQRDWTSIKRAMRYFKQTKDLSLKQTAVCDLNLIGYVDSDWASDLSTHKSQSGYLFNLENSPKSQSSKRQTSVALSSTKAEYIAATYASQEAVWLRQLLEDLGEPISQPTILYEDNVKLALNEKTNARIKHTDVRHHYIHDLIEQNAIVFTYCETNNMIADALTKPLTRNRIIELRSAIGLILQNSC